MDLQRRLILNAGVAAAAAALTGTPANAAGAAQQPIPAATGKAGDFNFLAGSWKINHRRLKQSWVAAKDWDIFEGEATCWTVLAGAASIEELRIPARGFSGLGIRLLDVNKHLWADYWVSGRDGVLTPPPMWGSFENGVGTFAADDLDDGHPIKARGIWDRITPKSCRWYQTASRDGGKTWEENWFMDWVRA